MYGFPAPILEEDSDSPKKVKKQKSKLDTSSNHKQNFGLNQEQEEEEQNFVERESDIFVRPQKQQSKQRANVAVIPESNRNGKPVPLVLQNAAETMLFYANDGFIRLNYDIKVQLEKFVHAPNEFTVVDPFIFISYTIWTGSCNIYMKDALPISSFILLLYFDCSFVVEIIPDGVTLTKQKKFTEVNISPYDGTDFSFAQSFKWKQILKEAFLERDLNQEEKTEDVNYFMQTLGELSSASVADLMFLQEQANLIGSYLNNQKIVYAEKKIGREK